jgi:serine/threonine protein kinase
VQLGLLDAAQIDTIETLLRPREAIPGYEVLDVRGRGGMGVVYRARQTNLGRTVALKTLLVGRLGDENFLNRFQQEARTLAQLRHPNIVSIYDFGRAAGRVYLAMEFIDGADVEGLVAAQGALPERVAWGIARQVAAGLAHGDRLGIVHRDIKPANLLLVDPPEGFPLPAGVPMVKIADFGLAMLTAGDDLQTRLTNENATVGSPQYMAPEQFQASRVDRRADMYSLGATVYQMLTGRPPFAGLNLTQLIGTKLSREPPPLQACRPDVDPATQALVARLLARDPAQRPDDYPTLLGAIDDACSTAGTTVSVPVHSVGDVNSATLIGDDIPTRVAVVPQPADEARPERRSRRRIFVAAGVGLLVIGILAAMTLPGRFSPAPVRVPMQEAGPSQYLFNGSSVFGWSTVDGEWTVPPGDAVIAGTDGNLAHAVPRAAGSSTPAAFRLLVVVELHTAGEANVQFALTEGPGNTAGDDAPGYIVQLTETSVIFGERSATGSIRPLVPVRQMLIGADQQHAVVVERLPTGWFVAVDETPIGAAPLRSGETPQLRLGAAGGTAWFSDIEFVELRPAR